MSSTSPLFAVDLTPKLFLVTLPAAAITLYAVYSIYVAFFGPVSHVPGPLLCKFTNAVDAYQTLVGGRRSEWIHSVHAQYGSVVRIGPNLMSINNPDCLKSVYGGKFPKSEPRYFGKHMDETEHMLIMNTHEKFRARRNILLPLFQQKNLQSFEPDLQHYTSVFLEQIEKEQKAEGSADVFRWFRLVAFDIICSLAYGVDMRMTAEGKKNKLVEWMEQVYVYFTLKDFIGKTIITVAESGVFGKLKDIASAEKKFVAYGEKLYTEGLEQGRYGNDDGSKTNLLDSLHRASEVDRTITKKHVATEAGAILIAGSDTTSTAMTYAAWELARKPEMQHKLREELKTISDIVSYPSGKQLESLPLFNGFLKEVLRLWPTLPGPLERRVPSGGATLSGVSLPENTEVTMQAYDLHRDGNVFIDPLQLKPERWLEETSAMKESFIPFSYGPRNCVGMNLAWIEIRTLMGALIRRYNISLDSKTTEASMACVEHFFTVPTSMDCRLRFQKLTE